MEGRLNDLEAGPALKSGYRGRENLDYMDQKHAALRIDGDSERGDPGGHHDLGNRGQEYY